MSDWESYEPKFEKMLRERDRELCFLDALGYLDQALSFLSCMLPPSQYNPFGNTGSAFKSKTFAVRSYSWNDEDDQQWNFAWQDVRVRWYKHLGRDMLMNKIMTHYDVCEMVIECLRSLMPEKDSDEN